METTFGFTRIQGLSDIHLLYYDGPWSDKDQSEIGPKVWTISGHYSDPWKKVLGRGRIEIAGDIQAGTRLMSFGARRLFTDIYGELSVDMDSYEFLGPWYTAVLVHSENINKKIELEPWRRLDKETALKEYLSSARIGASIDRLRLALVFLEDTDLIDSFLKYEGYFESVKRIIFMTSLLDQLISDIGAIPSKK